LPEGRYARLYAQRWWPVLLPVEALDDFGNVKDSFPNDVKITAEDGPLSEQLLLQLAGVGEYRLRLNASRRPWKQQTVVFSEVELTDPTLWTLHPPIIEAKRMDLDAKRNQAYIKFARAHGYLPREGEEQKEQADMVSAQITDRALDEASKERARADQIQREQLDRARAEAEAAKNQIARAEAEAAEAKRQADELKTKVQPGTPAAELLSVVSSVATLANTLKPADSFNQYLALEGEREKTRREKDKEERDAAREAARIERERADKLQAEIIAFRTAPPAAVTVATPPTRRQMLEDAVAEQTLLKQLSGRGGHSQEEEVPSKIDKWLELAPIVTPVVGSLIQGIFQLGLAGLQAWQNIHYNDALGKTGTPKPPETMSNNTQPTEPGKPIPPQAPPLTPEQIAQQQRWNGIMTAATMVVPHMLSSLESDPPESGIEFAEFIIKRGPEKRVSYDKLRNLAEDLKGLGLQVPGANDLERFINAARFVFEKLPAPMNRICGIPAVPKFLSEFHGYDEWMAEQEERQQ